MNKSIIIFCLIASTLIGHASCIHISTTKKSGKEITKEWNPESFDKIEILATIDAKVIEGTSFHVKIEGDEAYVEKIKVTVSNGCLRLDHDGYEFNGFDDVDAIITVPNPLKEISLKGVGEIECDAKVDPEQFNAKLSGVGKIEVEKVDTKRVNIESNGMGKVSVSGKTDLLYARNEGIGKIDCKDLRAKTVDCINTGIGKISVHATDTLRARSTGIGAVKYKGNPTIKEVKGSGIGGIDTMEE